MLAAGYPYKGRRPSSLNEINKRTILDLQIKFIKNNFRDPYIYLLGGYQIDKIAKKYQNIKYIYAPQWEKKDILNTLRLAPFDNKVDVLIMYGDTIFLDEAADRIKENNNKILIGIDTCWMNRYKTRKKNDIQNTELIKIKKNVHEFTGLIYFKGGSVAHFKKSLECSKDKSLLKVIKKLENNFKISYIDLKNTWAELNDPQDISKLIMGTKSHTMNNLKKRVKKSMIPESFILNYEDWKSSEKLILNQLKTRNFSKIIIRSSSSNEDNWQYSEAGKYKTCADIDIHDEIEIKKSINKVFESYKKDLNNEEVLIQEFYKNIKISGVAFTCTLENGAPYYKINIDEKTNKTNSITSGKINSKTYVISRFIDVGKIKNFIIKKLILSIKEIEKITHYNKLDIEFAVNHKNQIIMFQVRPIVVDHRDYEYDEKFIQNEINKNNKKLLINSNNLLGNKNIYSNMSDWNPAEIIGSRPKNLSSSIYEKVITNDIWSKQRSEFGYRNVKNQPLLYFFSGSPYVDIKASFNSFVPKDLEDKLAEKIINNCIYLLEKNKYLHDKIETEILFTCWTPNIKATIKKRYTKYLLTENEISKFEKSLKRITNKSIADLENKVSISKNLKKNREKIINSKKDVLDKFINLIDSSSMEGTLPFAHVARASFITMAWFKAFAENKITKKNYYFEFVNSLSTITSEFNLDLIKLNKKLLETNELIDKYGHLRPGTYEIIEKAYWEIPRLYFNNKMSQVLIKKKIKFVDSEIVKIKKFINKLDSKLSVEKIFKYFETSIIQREKIKFEFTKNISIALDLLVSWGNENKIKREDLSFLTFNSIVEHRNNSVSLEDLINIIKINKKKYFKNLMVEKPALILKKGDFEYFIKDADTPNFITLKKFSGAKINLKSKNNKDLKNKLVLIDSADPGFDWIFAYAIGGLITRYGGSNSHMAIRCAELNIPAAIGVGDVIFDKINTSNNVYLDCQNKILKSF